MFWLCGVRRGARQEAGAGRELKNKGFRERVMLLQRSEVFLKHIQSYHRLLARADTARAAALGSNYTPSHQRVQRTSRT